jgi:type VI protein secretion system component Hcp
MRKVFLKLEGIKGESQTARHVGAIEVSGFFWIPRQSPHLAETGHASINDLTVIKQFDKTSPFLSFASKVGQSFEGALTVEDISFRGEKVRSKVYALQSAVVESVKAFGDNEETVTLNCRSIKVVRS